MMTFNANLRPTYDDILCHPWMLGQLPTQHEITEEFSRRQVLVKAFEKA